MAIKMRSGENFKVTVQDSKLTVKGHKIRTRLGNQEIARQTVDVAPHKGKKVRIYILQNGVLEVSPQNDHGGYDANSGDGAFWLLAEIDLRNKKKTDSLDLERDVDVVTRQMPPERV